VIHSRADLKKVRRLVVKVGSSLLTDIRHGIRQEAVERIAKQIAQLKKGGMEVVVVSSGAVALGRVHIGWLERHLSVHEKQAAAAVGQPLLMRAYAQAFTRHGLHVAQMLLTKDDLRHRRRYLNASNTSRTLFSVGVVPIVNENDTVVVQEIKFGDNDTLGALVSLLIDADMLAMLTDVDGLHNCNPAEHLQAGRLPVVEGITQEIMAMAGGAGSHLGTGGMASKLTASRMATRGGVTSAIINGHEADSLARLMRGVDIGTLFLCGVDRQSKRQHWITEVLRPEGQIVVDAGAEKAIRLHGGSLLPVGVKEVHGMFDKGECVEIHGPSGCIARGLCNYNADEMRKLAGISSDQIESVLGYSDFSSVVHRDNLALAGFEQGA